MQSSAAPGAAAGYGIAFVPTTAADLAYVLAVERHPDNAPYIGQWSQAEHQAAIDSPNDRHWLIRAADQTVGYLIASGVGSPHNILNLTRLVVTVKGQGYGRAALRLLKHYAFIQCGLHRLQLDVKCNNPRAYGLYLSEGFVKEGEMRESFKTASGYVGRYLLAMLAQEYQG